MSAGTVLTQLSIVLKQIDSVTPKLVSGIRPTRDQLNTFRSLSTRLETASATIRSNLELLLTKAAPSEKELALAQKIRSATTMDHTKQSVTTTLQKNLILIFHPPDNSALDTEQVRIRKNKCRSRCEKLRYQKSDLILMWAMTLQPSAWRNVGGMTDNTFDFLIEELGSENFEQIPTQIAENIKRLKEEAPLNDCMSFQDFVKKLTEQTKAHQDQGTAASLKRKHVEEISKTPEELSHVENDDRQQQMDLQRMSKQIDYKMSSMPIRKLQRFIDGLPTAMETSTQWGWERELFARNFGAYGSSALDRTDCLHFFVPKNRNDISIVLVVGREAGLDLIAETDVEFIRV